MLEVLVAAEVGGRRHIEPIWWYIWKININERVTHPNIYELHSVYVLHTLYHLCAVHRIHAGLY